MDNLVHIFLHYMEIKERSTNTIAAYKTDINEFMEFIENDFNSINESNYKKFKKYLIDKKLSAKTINRKFVCINNFIRFLNLETDYNIKLKFELLKVQKQNYLDEMLSKNDFDRIVRAAKKEDDLRAIAIFYTLLMTGMRVSEMLQLKIEDTKEEYIQIGGKGNKYRDIFIADHLHEVWNDYLKVRIDNSEYLFTGQKGPINRTTVHSIIKKYAGKARVKLTKAHAHNFRHLFCLMAAEKGLSIDEIADLAGHSDINTTRIYTRKTKKQLRKALNSLFG